MAGSAGFTGGVLYETISRLNHSCTPNVRKEVADGLGAVISTLRDVAIGEELQLCYLSADEHEQGMTREQRREALADRYNFLCMCALCSGGPEASGVDIVMMNT